MELLAGLLQGEWWRALLLAGLFFAFVVIIVKFKERFAILGEFIFFLKERKLWWMTPIVVVFIMLSVLVVLTEKSALLAFSYILW